MPPQTRPRQHVERRILRDDEYERRDRGATLIEILVAIVLLGTVGVAVLTALATAATAASTQRNIALAQSWLATTGDVVSDPETVYLDCSQHDDDAIVATYQNQVDVTRAPDAPTVTVVDVDYWNGTVFADTCRFDSGERLQRVELLTDVDGTTMTLAVVKRPLEPPSDGLGDLPPGTGGFAFETTPGLDGA